MQVAMVTKAQVFRLCLRVPLLRQPAPGPGDAGGARARACRQSARRSDSSRQRGHPPLLLAIAQIPAPPAAATGRRTECTAQLPLRILQTDPGRRQYGLNWNFHYKLSATGAVFGGPFYCHNSMVTFCSLGSVPLNLRRSTAETQNQDYRANDGFFVTLKPVMLYCTVQACIFLPRLPSYLEACICRTEREFIFFKKGICD